MLSSKQEGGSKCQEADNVDMVEVSADAATKLMVVSEPPGVRTESLGQFKTLLSHNSGHKEEI